VPLQALLSYLDSEAERLVGATTAVGAAAAAAAASDAQRQRKAAASQGARRPGLGFLSAVSDMLAGVAGEAAAVAAPPSADQVRQQRQQQQQALSQAWAELQRVRWCPALVEAPAACLPWPAERTAVAAGGVSCSLVAPCAARPASDAWLVSGVLELVDGEVRCVYRHVWTAQQSSLMHTPLRNVVPVCWLFWNLPTCHSF
jgi:hypothetical protein